MTENTDDQLSLSTSQSSKEGSYSVSRESFHPRADLTYRVIEGVSLSRLSLRQSLLTGTILNGCEFVDVDFGRCDLDGMRIEDCTFLRCRFDNADIRSTDFVNCRLDETNLDGVYAKDCSFRECVVRNVTFRESTVTESTLHGGEFHNCDLSRSSWTLNRFTGVDVQRTTFGDCTFSYAVMQGCSFSETSINAESVGLIYGLTPNDLQGVGFVYLGESQSVPSEFDLSLLLRLYEERRWSLGVMVLRLNLARTSTVFAVREYIQDLLGRLGDGKPVLSDEIDFFLQIVRDLREHRRLPFLNVLEFIDAANRIDVPTGHISRSRVDAALSRLGGPLLLILTEMMDELSTGLYMDDGTFAKRVLLQATFVERPDVPLDTLLSELGVVSLLAPTHTATTVDRRSGSFVEVVSTVVGGVLALQLFLYLLNGSLIELIKLRARVEILTQKKLPLEFRRVALQTTQELPVNIREGMRLVGHYLNTVSWLPDSQLRGLNAENVLGLQIVSDGGARGSSPTREEPESSDNGGAKP